MTTDRKTALAGIAVGDLFHSRPPTTGAEVHSNPVIINSVAPLPVDIRAILLGLDRKYREAEYRRAEDPDWRLPAE